MNSLRSCVILAAGAGSRLNGLGVPKPLVPVLGVPLIERVILTASRAGLIDFTPSPELPLLAVCGHSIPDMIFKPESLKSRSPQIVAEPFSRHTHSPSIAHFNYFFKPTRSHRLPIKKRLIYLTNPVPSSYNVSGSKKRVCNVKIRNNDFNWRIRCKV